MKKSEIKEMVARLENYRSTHDLSQETMSRQLRVSVFSYSRWVNDRGLPGRQARDKIRELLEKE